MTTVNIELIEANTERCVQMLGIADQVAHMSTKEKLEEMARRMTLVKKPDAVKMLMDMKTMHEKLSRDD